MARGRGGQRASLDKGTLQTRFHGVSAFLSVGDRMRLAFLINTPPEKAFEAGAIELPKPKRPRTDREEREAVWKAVRDECESLLNKAARAPHARERRDPIGRAWYEGLLDGHGFDAAILRDLGREYGCLYWMDLQSLGTAQAGYDERVGRPNARYKFRMAELTGKDAARFTHFDNILISAGHPIRRSVQALCVDEIWFLDGPAWLDRCINSHRAAKVERGEVSDQPYGDGARRADIATLTYAIAGLKALAGGLGR